MFLKKKIFFSTTVFLLAGLLAINLCQIHPTSEDTHASTHQEEANCNSGEMISPALPSSLVEGSAQIPPQAKILNVKFFTSDFGDTFLKQVSQSPFHLPFSPIQTTKRYKFTCAYLI